MTSQWKQWIWLKGDPVSFTEVKTDGATKWVWLQLCNIKVHSSLYEKGKNISGYQTWKIKSFINTKKHKYSRISVL